MIRRALVEPTGKSVVPFCSTDCRTVYAEFLPEWGESETVEDRPLNHFGHPYWRAACSTCGVPW